MLFNTSQTYVSRLHFVHYSSRIPRINILCPSFSHIHHLGFFFSFFFFWGAVPDIFKKYRKLPTEQQHLNTLIILIFIISWVVSASIAAAEVLDVVLKVSSGANPCGNITGHC